MATSQHKLKKRANLSQEWDHQWAAVHFQKHVMVCDIPLVAQWYGYVEPHARPFHFHPYTSEYIREHGIFNEKELGKWTCVKIQMPQTYL